MLYQWNPKKNRAFLILSVLLLSLVLAIVWWAQTGQEHSGAVLVIKQLTIALLLLVALGFVLWLMKTLLDSSTSINESESLKMRVRDGENDKHGLQALVDRPPVVNADSQEPVDTQAEIDRIRAMIADDPEKVARIVERWIGVRE